MYFESEPLDQPDDFEDDLGIPLNVQQHKNENMLIGKKSKDHYHNDDDDNADNDHVDFRNEFDKGTEINIIFY